MIRVSTRLITHLRYLYAELSEEDVVHRTDSDGRERPGI